MRCSRSEQYPLLRTQKPYPAEYCCRTGRFEYRLQDDDAVYRMEARIHAGGKTYAAKRLHSVSPRFLFCTAKR